MKSLTVTRNQCFEMIEEELPKINDNTVLIKVAFCGICGSDLPRFYSNGVHNYPQVLGHEFSGVVEDIGGNIKNIEIGEKVAVAPLIPCGNCPNCLTGNPAMCNQYSFIGSRQPGAMSEYVLVPEQNCIKLPKTISLKEASLIEPLTVAIHGVDRIVTQSGDIALVLGCGTIGLLTIGVLKARGITKIIATDINEEKLEIAKKIGASEIINPLKIKLEDYFNDKKLPNIVYETAGSNITQIEAIRYCGYKGQVCFIGTSTKDITFNPTTFEKILRRELIVTGSWMSYSAPFPGKEWKAAVSYIDNKDIDVSLLITDVFKLEDGRKAFDKMVEKNSKSIKVLYQVMEDINE